MGETIVVVGAGVSGLTCALLLAKNSEDNEITIVAKHMPGDYDIEYASPFAGANFCPMATEDTSWWERRSWPELKRICEEVPEAGIHFQKCHIARRQKDLDDGVDGFPESTFDPKPWFAGLFDDWQDLPKSKTVPGYDTASEFTSVCINTAIYLPWLVGQVLQRGVVLKRGVLGDIGEAKHLSHTGRAATVVVNTTGLGARKLGGVRDARMQPARGQVVLVRNEATPMLVCSGTEHGHPEETYLMQRAAGGGTVIGGTYDVGNWESQPDPTLAARIMARAVKLRPEIAGGRGVEGLSVIRHMVGLRPFREGGLRLEEERLDDETWIVHNYGHSGWGYQASYGCAENVVELVDKIRKNRGRAKL